LLRPARRAAWIAMFARRSIAVGAPLAVFGTVLKPSRPRVAVVAEAASSPGVTISTLVVVPV
jgi:hypothetical protein